MWPDSNGNICQMKRTMVTISEEEYDRVAQVHAVSYLLASTKVLACLLVQKYEY
jgi:hypothetical protein